MNMTSNELNQLQLWTNEELLELQQFSQDEEQDIQEEVLEVSMPISLLTHFANQLPDPLRLPTSN